MNQKHALCELNCKFWLDSRPAVLCNFASEAAVCCCCCCDQPGKGNSRVEIRSNLNWWDLLLLRIQFNSIQFNSICTWKEAAEGARGLQHRHHPSTIASPRKRLLFCNFRFFYLFISIIYLFISFRELRPSCVCNWSSFPPAAARGSWPEASWPLAVAGQASSG